MCLGKTVNSSARVSPPWFWCWPPVPPLRGPRLALATAQVRVTQRGPPPSAGLEELKSPDLLGPAAEVLAGSGGVALHWAPFGVRA